MEKIPVILVVLNRDALDDVLVNLNMNTAQPIAVFLDDVEDDEYMSINDIDVPMYSFASIQKLIVERSINVWLICGDISNAWKMAKFLIANGVKKDNIVNFSMQLSLAWIGNIRYIEQNDVDFFSTGISYAEVGLDVNCITKATGVNLAGSNQDLRQGYLTAKYVFEHVKPHSIKFVLIGLAPYSFRYDNLQAFSVCTRNLQYELTLKNSVDESFHGQLLKILISENFKQHFMHISKDEADINFNGLKNFSNKEITAADCIQFEQELKNQTKSLRQNLIDQNIQILQDYIALCQKNGAKPILFTLPVAKALHDNYNAEMLSAFRQTVQQITHKFNCLFIDLFDLNLNYKCFYNLSHLNIKGAFISSSILDYHLHVNNVLSASELCDVDYDKFYLWSQFSPKVDGYRVEYRNLQKRVIEASILKMQKKSKIKVGFVLFDSSLWCGDKLYNNFAKDKRFNTTIFFCLRHDEQLNDLGIADFEHGIKQFKSRGLNVCVITDSDADIPRQDILIMLTPYTYLLPNAFQIDKLTAQTLLISIPYGFGTTANAGVFKMHNPIATVWWIIFSTLYRDTLPRPPYFIYSGRPKMDIFFESNNLKFDWKLAKPNAVKIIYAPHWAIESGIMFSTFHMNCQFFYEYAKMHPETSWIVKPHPNLLKTAVSSGLFADEAAFNDYLQNWNELPNAKVYTGAYYQDIFATSDGMILDSNSFLCEYQYTHKPLLFLTRDTQKFNKFGDSLMQVLYKADGRDFAAIDDFIQNILIGGKDTMQEVRMKFFDEHFNYKKATGMLASDFIYKTIVDAVFKNKI